MIRIAANMKAGGSKSDESDAAYQFQPESRTPSYSEKTSSHMPPTPAEQEMSGNVASDTEPMVKGFEFSDATIRRGFIRKVYGILSVGSSVYFIRKTTSTYLLFGNKFSTYQNRIQDKYNFDNHTCLQYHIRKVAVQKKTKAEYDSDSICLQKVIMGKGSS